MVSIVLVCLGNFQEYIMTNIAQLLHLGHTDIHVITSSSIMHEFEPFASLVTIASADILEDEFQFNARSQLDKQFRSGFWHYTSARLFVLYAYMKATGLYNVIHLENDVLIYHHCSTIQFEKRAIYMPFDTYSRNIASIMYIPDASILGDVLKLYDYTKNDMQNFANKPGLIENLPICPVMPGMNDEQRWVSSDNPTYIFDAAAMGQMVGGVDPRNISGDTRGFVNETCVIKYNDYGTIVWNAGKPYYRLYNAIEIPIFNLHIHSKNLHLYTS
jgi:hypothetical protein